MKKILYIIGVAVATMFASCQKDADVADNPIGDNAVSFTAESITPLTRVSGSNWEAGDAIGITMVKVADDDDDFPTIYYDNVKYTADEGGTSVSLTADSDVIYYPEDGSSVSFMGFYPYQESWSYETLDMVFDISAQDGTLAAQSLVDLLISSADSDESGDAYELEFEHFLSKVQVTVSNFEEDSVFDDLTDLTASINSYYTKFNIFDIDDEISKTDEPKELTMVKTMDGDKAIFTVILAPGTVSEEIIFTDGTNTYSAPLAIANADMGTQYNFTATVGDQGITTVELSLAGDSVTDWVEQTESVIDKVFEIEDMVLVDGVYQINTAAGLKEFADLVNGGSTSIKGKLMCNINLSTICSEELGSWAPIGDFSTTSDVKYYGTFDGGGFEVSGLYIDNSGSNYQGLFGYTYNATISNIGVVDSSVTGYKYVGAVVGYFDGDSTNTFTSCYNCNTAVYAENGYGGGVAGCVTSATFTSCYNTGSVSGDGGYVGGVVGAIDYSTVTSCYNTGSVSSGGGFVGGVAGSIGNSTIATSCYNTGNVSGYGSYVGGVVGYNSASTLTLSYNTGSVTGSSGFAGGVVGYNYTSSSAAIGATITSCYSTGDVSGYDRYLGGAVGYNNNSTITNCYYDKTNVGTYREIDGIEYYAPTSAVGGVDDDTNCCGLVTADMQGTSCTLLTYLNTIAIYWMGVADDYPTLYAE